MSNEQEKINRWFKQYGWNHQTFFNRPHATRRHFLELMGSGVTASFLAQHPAKAADVSPGGAAPKGTAQNVIFILMAGAPSHTDTFDFKMVNGVTPAAFNPATINGIYFPTGLMPKLATLTNDFAIARSVRAHAVVHTVSQTWVQIGRNPLAALGNIAPNIGSIVAAEKFPQRRPTDIFPTFLALNSNGAVNQGYLSGKYAPFKVTPSTAGISNTTNPTGQTRFENRFKLLQLAGRQPADQRAQRRGNERLQRVLHRRQAVDVQPEVNQYFGYHRSARARNSAPRPRATPCWWRRRS